MYTAEFFRFSLSIMTPVFPAWQPGPYCFHPALRVLAWSFCVALLLGVASGAIANMLRCRLGWPTAPAFRYSDIAVVLLPLLGLAGLCYMVTHGAKEQAISQEYRELRGLGFYRLCEMARDQSAPEPCRAKALLVLPDVTGKEEQDALMQFLGRIVDESPHSSPVNKAARFSRGMAIRRAKATLPYDPFWKESDIWEELYVDTTRQILRGM